MTVMQMLRGLLKFLAVAVGAGALGVGVGVGLAEVGGGDDATTALETSSSPSATTATTLGPATTTSTTPSTTTAPATQTTETTETLALTQHVDVLSALLCPATAAGEQVNSRARVTIRVRVTNRDSRPLAAQAPRLLVGAARIGSVPDAKDDAGALLKALAPAASATGTLRFQTSGSVTQRLTGQRRARLGIAGRTVAAPIEIGLSPSTCD
jgi:hypothetical protein